MSSFLNVLRRNNLIFLLVNNTVPIKARTKISRYFNKSTSIRIYSRNDTAVIDLNNKNIKGLVPVFYWDGKPNFGDLIGPYLISKMTRKPVLNIKDLRYSGIMSVGSIIHMLDRKNMVIWGSGLMYEPTNMQLKRLKNYNPQILSVRGHETAKQLTKAGLSLPDDKLYGDPALILPFFYKPQVSKDKKIGICPHYIHKSNFLKNIIGKNELKIINVQNDVETVIDEIASSSVCISTSLHGLIIAQAYNVPWVWLEIIDENLTGEDFKFNDFFSTLDKLKVAHIRVSLDEIKSIDYKAIAKSASLPSKRYNEHLILETMENHLSKLTM